MVGSPDFNNEAIAGQINMADSPTRQPGSSIKPINYRGRVRKRLDPCHPDLGCAQRIPALGRSQRHA